MDRTFDVLVAGGGIAGFTAGLTAARLGRSTLVLTGDVPGGQLLSIEKVEGYPGYPDGVPGYDLCPMTQDQAVAAGAEVTAGELTGLSQQNAGWRVATAEGDVQASTVILATGTHLKELGVPGEARLRGKGVSHCASCDAPLLRNRIAVVVGGGDSAMQESLTLAAAASKVIIVHRGAALSGQAAYRNRIGQQPNIEIRFNSTVEEILGADSITGVRLQGGAEIEAHGVFVYVGLAPNTAALNGLLKLDSAGRILTDGEMRTGLPGLYAAGTVRAGSSGRAIAAAGEGTMAALVADRELGGSDG
jgi:thioredoxin reductase (NADPH)